ncbi:hypothetical protein [Aeoliella mucimassa]|uniref:Uncharacterized protein n=1 Tax=Aeoliella mucimassa TaxID=2527972 RepID=A0A518AHW1_9BACT|nr:hypothetical protein [Aeoliella mucimassa]QDU54312.1 hypothetical protein Pan181_04930 [Aeoliella mucimassa]
MPEVRATTTFPATSPTLPSNDTPESAEPSESQHRYAWHTREQRAVPIAIEQPPAKTEVIETNRYVPYETNHFQHAYTWAAEQVARKLPAAVETLRMLDSLIRQQVNAQRSDKSSEVSNEC